MRILCFIILCTFSSCDYIMGVENLGGGYYFDTDQVLYTENPSYDGIGMTAIPTKVIRVECNDDFIIATSINKVNKDIYWVIKKREKAVILEEYKDDSLLTLHYKYENIIGPLDRDSFNIVSSENKIDLHFITE